ncbi:hypothetical protein J5N97_029442 [Dioscorea zingiberensis]|uniref:Transcription repressor n=1 Tax=Dioscorea zingiberensis TaxID=325984 RepID=A0A9D5H5X1_9LILI|nr:hypothetical protein J5N97_029442 [Dioscorea zingiberensis]
MKALHHVISPICMQEVKTNSFRAPPRDPIPINSSSFNSIYYTPSTITDMSSSFSSIDLSKELIYLKNNDEVIDENLGGLPEIISGRFFFSPSISKSIMEGAKEEGEKTVLLEALPERGRAPAFYEESVTVTVASDDPYRDFRASMEEMVVAHGLREWPRLQELLHCYLKLNEKKTHKVIVLAFMDLLMQLMAQDDN